MDFLYLSFALLLSVTMCVGQTEETPPAPTFELKIYPEVSKTQISVGDNKILTCVASAIEGSDPPNSDELTFEWTKDGEPITNEDKSMSPSVQLKTKSYSLRLDEATEEDAGLYRCTVTEAGGQSVFKEIRLEIFEPLVVEAEPKQFGIKGQDGDIMCKATSQPPPEVSWKDPNGDEIGGTTEKYILAQDKLTVKNLDFTDAGTYVCDVSILTSGTLESYNIEFDVVEVPHIPGSLGIQPENPKVGDEVKITCKAEGIPAPTYAFKRGEALMPSTQVDDAQGILTLPDLKREDEGDYTCIATNKGGFAEKVSQLDVLIPPVVEDIPDVPDAVEESRTSVVCKASGDPEPAIAWRKVGMEVDYNEGTQVGGPTIERTADSPGNAEIKEVELKMIFDPIKAEHAGEYECTAFSTVGKATKKVNIEVQYKPIFQPVNGDVFYGWRGHRANLTCQVKANPAASLMWKKAMADDPTKMEEIPNEDKYTITDLRQDGHISTRSLLIMITEESEADVYMDYICEATNVQAVVEKALTLTQATAPAAPLVKEGPILSNMATVYFEKPAETGGKPVESFVYKYMEEGGNPTEPVTVEASESDDQTKVELSGLKPSTKYIITVQAKSLVGAGSEQSVIITTKAVSVPLRLILDSPEYGVDAESFLVKWKKPNDGGSPITSFIIRYKQVEVSGASPNEWTIISDVDSEFKTKTVNDGTALSTSIDGLQKDSYYELIVVAVNSEGESEQARRIIKTSVGEGGENEGGKDDDDDNGDKKGGDEEDGGENEEGAAGSSKGGSASASLGSGLIIGIIVGIIVFLILIVLIVIIVAKRRPRLVGKLRGKGGDEERGKADDGKEAAEEEKLIQKEDKAKVENETADANKDAVVEEKPEEFEPETKPEAPAEAPADKPADVPAVELKSDAEVTPTPPENSTA